MSVIKIRVVNRYSHRVYDSVKKLLPQLSSNSENLSVEHLKDIVASKSSQLIIAEDENKVIAGMLTLGTYVIPSGIKVWIEDVVVDEAFRGKGIGVKLTLFAIQFARSKGATSVELTSRPSRIAANKLYSKLGFVQRNTNVYRFELD